MKINVSDNFFTRAKPIWAKGLEKEKNITYKEYIKKITGGMKDGNVYFL